VNNLFTDHAFYQFRDFIQNNYGICYTDAKRDLLKIKLDKCLLKSGVNSYNDYFELINSSSTDIYLKQLINQITVNKTSFFREEVHFDFIKSNIEYILEHNPSITEKKEIRIWSLASSTGQEAYTLAMVMRETLSDDYKIRILATDVSERVLKIAKAGVYPMDIKDEIPAKYLIKYFDIVDNKFHIKKEIKELVSFRQFNLVNEFSFSGKFDIVFCRNVMIYFNVETQQKLLDKIYNYISPGGLLILGQCEILINKRHLFEHINSTIYMK
jgi:chemotaxis protein methyltransferase CheR